jgi:hypothetical protein
MVINFYTYLTLEKGRKLEDKLKALLKIRVLKNSQVR